MKTCTNTNPIPTNISAVHIIDGQCQWQSMPCPLPKAGEVLIKVSAFGINRADLLQKAGHYPAPQGESSILGLEVSGEIYALGTDVPKAYLQQKVMALVPGGGYSEYVCVDVRHCVPMPDHLTWVEAAALMETYTTVYQTLVDKAQLKAGETLLVHAAASGVGTAAVRVAKYLDAKVIATVSNEKKAHYVKALGANHVYQYQNTDFVKSMADQGLQADVILDPIGAQYVKNNLKVANTDCRWVMIALLGGCFSEEFDLARVLAKRIHLIGSTLRSQSHDEKARLIQAMHALLSDGFQSGALKADIDTVFKRNDVEKAHTVMASNQNLGKLVVDLSQ